MPPIKRTYNTALCKLTDDLYRYRTRDRRRVSNYGAVAGLDAKVVDELENELKSKIMEVRRIFWRLEKLEADAWKRINEVPKDKMASRNAPQAR